MDADPIYNSTRGRLFIADVAFKQMDSVNPTQQPEDELFERNHPILTTVNHPKKIIRDTHGKIKGWFISKSINGKGDTSSTHLHFWVQNGFFEGCKRWFKYDGRWSILFISTNRWLVGVDVVCFLEKIFPSDAVP